MIKTVGISDLFPNPVPPFAGWQRRIYRISRPLSRDDIDAFIGNEEIFIRKTGTGTVNIIHKFGLAEINCIIGERDIEVWFSPEKAGYSMQYVEALLATRF